MENNEFNDDILKGLGVVLDEDGENTEKDKADEEARREYEEYIAFGNYQDYIRYHKSKNVKQVDVGKDWHILYNSKNLIKIFEERDLKYVLGSLKNELKLFTYNTYIIEGKNKADAREHLKLYTKFSKTLISDSDIKLLSTEIKKGSELELYHILIRKDFDEKVELLKLEEGE